MHRQASTLGYLIRNPTRPTSDDGDKSKDKKEIDSSSSSTGDTLSLSSASSDSESSWDNSGNHSIDRAPHAAHPPLGSTTKLTSDESSRDKTVAPTQDTNDEDPDDTLLVIDPITLSEIIDSLSQRAFDLATDEPNLQRQSRFVATKDNKRVQRKGLSYGKKNPWNSVYGKDVLLWTGESETKSADSVSTDLPLHKARGLIQTSPRNLAEYLMDSTEASVYDELTVTRHDHLIFQEGIDTSVEDGAYGIPGACKLVRTISHVPGVPTRWGKTRNETSHLSLMQAQPIKPFLESQGKTKWVRDRKGMHSSWNDCYLIVQRQVFAGNDKEIGQKLTELVLSVHLIRPACATNKISELTTVTHVASHNKRVPKWLANQVGLATARRRIRGLQQAFNPIQR